MQKKDKVLIVSPTPPPYSGPEIMTQHLLNSSLKDEYELIHFNISKQRGMDTKARFDFTNIFYGIIQPFQLFILLVRHQPDVMYTNLAQNLGGFLRYASFIVVASPFKTKIVVRVMGDGFKHFYKKANPILKQLIRLTVTRINQFIVRAQILTEQFSGIVEDHKLSVVYSGIDTIPFTKAKERQDNGILVLFVGYLTKAKGALDLLQVVPIVAGKWPDITFQLMGAKLDIERNITYVDNPTSNEEILRNLLAQESVKSNIDLLGVQYGEDKISSFVNADIFVLPSYSEAFPTVVLEAMAAGLPVIATPVGALPEAFDKKHICFVTPGDISQLADAILQLVQDHEKRVQMGQVNRANVQQSFSLESYASRVGDVFKMLLSKK